MHYLKTIVLYCCVLCASVAPVVSAQTSANSVALIIRTDDVGMSHSVNLGMQRLVSTGMPVSVSVMFACPWYQEAVEILKQHPNASVGIHLVLNSEWKNYRWGPVAGATAVPSLVDENGFFFPSSEVLHQRNPNIAEVETELRAQIDRALRSGVKIDYVDYHMGTAVRYPEFQAVTERLAQEYGLGMSHYFGETEDSPQYFAPPARKVDSLLVLINRMKPGLNMVITHVGIDDAELGALLDMNTDQPLPDMSKNRQGELTALTSTRFSAALKARNVVLLTYRDVIAKEGLKSMRRPVG
jgi:chitin disaccharide deacetylase